MGVFALIQTLYTFTSTSKAHSICYPDKQVHQLQGLSDTRWACRQSAVHAVCTRWDSLLVLLKMIVINQKL